jgi:hypothetical protein
MATAKKTKKSNTKSSKPAASEGATVTPIKAEKKPAAEKLPWLKREGVKWARLFKRAKTLSGRLNTAQGRKHSPDLVDAIDAASEALAQLDSVINALNDGEDSYNPGGMGGGGKGKPEVGSIVCFTEKGKEKYKDLLDEEDMVDLEVVLVKGSMLNVKAVSGDKFKIPRGQVRVQESQDPDDGDLPDVRNHKGK